MEAARCLADARSDATRLLVSIRAVFFDLGGTLFSYGSLRSLFGDTLAGVADEHGLDVGRDEIRNAYQVSVMTVMADYVNRPYYLHRDLFAEAHEKMLARLGVPAGQGADSPIAAGGDLVSSWRRDISEDQVARAVEILRLFGLDRFYAEGDLPCAEPAEGTAAIAEGAGRPAGRPS